jgi:hypothetical protein
MDNADKVKRLEIVGACGELLKHRFVMLETLVRSVGMLLEHVLKAFLNFFGSVERASWMIPPRAVLVLL